jgi:hypothetical protein
MEIHEPCINPIETTLVVMECCLMKNQHHHQSYQFCLLSSVGVGGPRVQVLARKPKSKVIKIFNFVPPFPSLIIVVVVGEKGT